MSAAVRLANLPVTRRARRVPVPRSPFDMVLWVGIFVILTVTALRLGYVLLAPIACAALLTLLLNPLVRTLRRRAVPESVGAGLVVFGMVGVLGVGIGMLAGPANDWIQRAPGSLGQVETRIRRLVQPLTAIQRTADKVEQAANPSAAGATPTVQLESPNLVKRLTGGTASLAGAVLTVVFLTYFLLVTEPMFRRKMVRLVSPERRERVQLALSEIEAQMSRYLLLETLISLAVGLATWAVLAAAGLPNAILWAAVAVVLNFVPYVGAVATLVLIGAAALISFDAVDRVLLTCGGVIAIQLLEGNLLTPAILGRHMPLNSVTVFIAVLFWGWVWGVPGAIMAVPLTVMAQVFCDHVDRLRPVAVLLGR